MILCQCHGVNERTIRRAVRHGADTVEEVGEHCQAGTGCGACHASILQIIAEHGSVLVEPTRRLGSVA